MKLDRLLKATFHDWPAKVLSLAIALLLMLFFNLTRLEQRTISIPLTISINDEMAPSSQYPRMIRVTLRGERDVIYGVRDDEISASLDLAEFKNEGVFRAPIRLEKRGNALLADPLEIYPEPSEVAIGLERRVAKAVPVTPLLQGLPRLELRAHDLRTHSRRGNDFRPGGPRRPNDRSVDRHDRAERQEIRLYGQCPPLEERVPARLRGQGIGGFRRQGPAFP